MACLSAEYKLRLASFAMLISDLSGGCSEYVVEELKRLLYLRNGNISCDRSPTVRKEVCRSLARLATLKKRLHESLDNGVNASSDCEANALVELRASLSGAHSYISKTAKHPVVYLQLATLFPTALYTQTTPDRFQLLLLDVFNGIWNRLASLSLESMRKISRG